jgi:4-hydroxybenzoate polyprenyltransferase
MSTTASAPALAGRYARVLRYLVLTRGVEVCALQASPLLGAHLGGLGLVDGGARSWLLLLLGSTALTAHVFAFNDWAGFAADARNPRRANVGAGGYDISRDQIGHVAIALLVVAGAALIALGWPAIAFGAAIAGLSLLYSFSPRLGKQTPVAASLNHLIGGALHFLLGYTVAHALDASGGALSLVFGLVFAAGHLNQEVRDYDADLRDGVRTSAVAFGCRRAFVASFCIFTVAYLLIVALALLGVLPELMLLSAVAWLLQAGWSWQAWRRGLGSETAVWMQRRYRVLFALVGLAMLV